MLAEEEYITDEEYERRDPFGYKTYKIVMKMSDNPSTLTHDEMVFIADNYALKLKDVPYHLLSKEFMREIECCNGVIEDQSWDSENQWTQAQIDYVERKERMKNNIIVFPASEAQQKRGTL